MNARMPYRRSMRLSNYDYSSCGFYYVTICARDRKKYFGDVVGADPRVRPELKLNDAGMMVEKTWREIPEYYAGVEIDEYIVMPNHMHGTINLIGRPQGGAPTLSLCDVMHRFKSLTTTRYRQGVMNGQWPRFDIRLWQRGYHDHIIRSDQDLSRIREYIRENPMKWQTDEYHM